MKKIFTIITLLAASLIFSNSAFAYIDFDSTHKYSDAIDLLTERGIVSGYADDTYRPEGDLNRAELLKIVMEARYSAELEDYAGRDCFTDIPFGEWYTPYVCFAKDMGFVNGYLDGSFGPGQKINFVEAAKMILEAYDYTYLASDPWFKNIVEVSSNNNLIPLDTTSFNEFINRGQMGDFIARMIHNEEGTLSDYLGMKSDFRVTFESLENGVNVEENLNALIANNVITEEDPTDPTDPADPSDPTDPADPITLPANYILFTSNPYSFTTVQPSDWFFFGEVVGDADTLHHYGFGAEITNEVYDADENLINFDLIEAIALDIVGTQGPAGDPAGEELSIGKEYAFKVESAGDIFIYITDGGRNYRLSGAAAYEDVLIEMATNISNI